MRRAGERGIGAGKDGRNTGGVCGGCEDDGSIVVTRAKNRASNNHTSPERQSTMC